MSTVFSLSLPGRGSGEGNFRTDAGLFPHLTLSPKRGEGTDRVLFDVVISLEAARWLYFYVK